jgi:hypothetical protein
VGEQPTDGAFDDGVIDAFVASLRIPIGGLTKLSSKSQTNFFEVFPVKIKRLIPYSEGR